MPKYMCCGTYTKEGVQGLLEEGGSSRREMAKTLAESMGGTLEAFYYALGEEDLYIILDLPDNATTAALSLAVIAIGAFNIKTTVLLTPEEIDQAAQKTVEYRPPGR